MKWGRKGLGPITRTVVTFTCAALFVAYSVLNVPASSVDTNTEPSIAKILKWLGLQPRGLTAKASGPSALTINSDIDFGTAFPRMTSQGEFTVLLSDIDSEGSNRVEYHLTLSGVSGYLDLTPYLTVVRHPAETDTESDNVTSASVDTSLDDISDRWLVTLSLPKNVVLGDYWTTLTVMVDQTYP
jgi:hypothetical protein